MTTLGALKAEIAGDLVRSDLANEVASAIASAITFYKTTRFFFNETRTTTFTSVAAQSDYTAADNANIPLFFAIDDIYVQAGSATPIPMAKTDPDEIEFLIGGGAGSSGQPFRWSWFAKALRFYPIPADTSFTFRVIGAREFAAPASDDEVDNVWMTDGYELIRCRAKGLLFLHVIKNADQAAIMLGQDGNGGAAGMAKSTLRRATTDRRGSGRIKATSF